MPLELPNLDDRRFTDLVDEALSMLPRYAPEWTNHNPSDPGITLIELLAFFTEMFIYRLDRIGRAHKIQFLRLLRGPDRYDHRPVEEVDAAIRETVLGLWEPQRAVTAADFEYLARKVAARDADGDEAACATVVRAHCAPRRNLRRGGASREQERPGHVSVVIVPGDPRQIAEQEVRPEVAERLRLAVRDYLAPRCLLTTRVHVVLPYYLWVSLGALIRPRDDIPFHTARHAAIQALQRHFGPLPGEGPSGEGWPFGRSLYLAEVIDVLERVPQIDYVRDVRVIRMASSEEELYQEPAALGIQIGIRSTVGVDARIGTGFPQDRARLLRGDAGQLVAVELKSFELIRIAAQGHHFEPVGPGGSGAGGHRHRGVLQW
ncbi:MAG: baseplate J/gp47 family protein [Gammaproteobacteria bacterium]